MAVGLGIYKKMANDGANTMYTCMSMEKWDLLKLFQEWEEEE
jgi:hypothetical protein